MLKILIFSKGALENGRGGEISFMELATGLQKYYNITIIDTNQLLGKGILSKEDIHKKLKGIKRSTRINFARLKIYNKYISFPYPSEILKLYRYIKKNQIIYTSSGNIKINLLLILFSLLLPQQKFIISHRAPLYSEKNFSIYNLRSRISLLFFSLFKNKFYHHTISCHAKKFLENFYNPNKVTHIIHGIELENFSKDNFKKKNSSQLRFLYVGYLDDVHKGVGVLLKAIEKLIETNRDLKILFEFCGTGPLESNLRKLENKFPKYVKYHGYISNELIAEYYKRNDVFILTSRREPFGRVIVEALAAELIIICSKTIGAVEILKGKEFAFFLEDLNFGTIKDKIIKVYNLWIEDPYQFEQLKRLAKEYAFKNFSISKEIFLFKNLINKISRKDV